MTPNIKGLILFLVIVHTVVLYFLKFLRFWYYSLP